MQPLYCVVGISGSGKDSVVQEMCRLTGKKQVISYATRPRRINEGETHIFIKPEDVVEYERDFAAYTEINGYSYFTTKSQLLDPEIMFYIIDPNGVKWLKQNFNERDIYVIYVRVDPDTSKQRALSRGDSEETYDNRHKSEIGQFMDFIVEKEYDSVIDNCCDLDFAILQFTHILVGKETEW